MGYGGSLADAEAVGRSGDGGIDGIIKEDSLGLEEVYIQAKRWEHKVPEKEIRDFTGALTGKGAQKGNFYYNFRFHPTSYKICKRDDMQKDYPY